MNITIDIWVRGGGGGVIFTWHYWELLSQDNNWPLARSCLVKLWSLIPWHVKGLVSISPYKLPVPRSISADQTTLYVKVKNAIFLITQAVVTSSTLVVSFTTWNLQPYPTLELSSFVWDCSKHLDEFNSTYKHVLNLDLFNLNLMYIFKVKT